MVVAVVDTKKPSSGVKKKRDEREHLALFSNDCKRCKALDPAEKTTFTACHYSKGNEYCPASEVQIVVVGAAYRLAKQLKAARDQRDAQTEARIMVRVAKETEAFQERFYQAIETGEEQ